jgi:3-hydroxyacyl-[acyl-carrier-protein] dehydratase
MRFLMVDAVSELEPGVRIVASKTLPGDEELFQDHFPGFPVVPGVLITEMMAQAGGKCLFAGDPDRGIPVLARVREAVFRTWIAPDQEVVLECEVSKDSKLLASVKAKALVAGKVVANADLSYAFVKPGDQGFPDTIPEILSLEP